ncbi:unnamed protein product, partial [Porites lobata]
HLPSVHAYADDTQLYLAFKPACASSTDDAIAATERIHFKIIIITFKAIHGQVPVYLQELISKREEKRYNLRSCAMGIMLQTPRTLTKKTLGDRAFLAAAPKLWNGLPSQIRNEPNFHRFKGFLKTHFFRLAFY